ncbi:type III PLP-dependent enzyme [Spirilliplanes yamanashiensis]|uniref:ornithine decarboxylase n=1 Tax=Spirilliplanes yamanashiensis TaxID=42233 RepID=A0A8J4DL09_9ACTN|nr:type III PLP-dependent enzyme [Spirilliplanes yamanashiensis]MDP9816365.1 ornithine decarboxylase [Spirilliplanes yamanashiensis]GIJ05892.1 ornithine decarboxylase [Spirilliplanes yamanashiensis]
MTIALDGHRAQPRLPGHWPAALSPEYLALIDVPTPYLVTDLDTLVSRYTRFSAALPGVSTFYAMKCNSTAEIVQTLHRHGAGFEVASIGELNALQALGVDPAEALYSNPIKPPAHVAAAHAAGLWRFGFDSPGELRKIAEYAPGSAVYLRLRVDDSTSVFPLSRKFGAELSGAYDLMLLARRLGLRPYGVTFHVGSQCANPSAWRQAIAAAGTLMRRLATAGIRLSMLNLGGGFPARYVSPVPSIEDIAGVIVGALDELLPYRPEVLAAEPGRHLVAETAVMATTVLGREVRAGENWLYVDVGAYNGLMETQQTVSGWRFPLWTSLPHHADEPCVPFTVTGPSCDSSDTMFYGVSLPDSLEVGDKLYIGSAGAYTLSYASAFNGFAPPTPLFVGEPGAGAR